MALINCKECGKEISDKAKACPNCGYPLDDELNSKQNVSQINSLHELNDKIKLYNDEFKSNKYKSASKKGIKLFIVITICIVVYILARFSQDLKNIDTNSNSNLNYSKGLSDANIIGLGEKTLIDDKYTITLIGVNETQERNQFETKEYEQVVTIYYLYENIAYEGYLSIDQPFFEVVDEEGNICAPYPIGGKYNPKQTPKGAKSLGSFSVGLNKRNNIIKLNFYDNIYNTNNEYKFRLTIGESISPLLSGNAPKYEDAYGIGDIIEIDTIDGKYALSIDSINKKANDESLFENAVELYEINYTYFNIDYQKDLFIGLGNFRVIDSNGTMAGACFDSMPKGIKPGEKCSAFTTFGTYTNSDYLIVHYSDSVLFEKQIAVIDSSDDSKIENIIYTDDSIDLLGIYGKDKDYIISKLGDGFTNEVDDATGESLMIYDDIMLNLGFENKVTSIYIVKDQQKDLKKYNILGITFENNYEMICDILKAPNSNDLSMIGYYLGEYTWAKFEFDNVGNLINIRIFYGPEKGW